MTLQKHLLNKHLLDKHLLDKHSLDKQSLNLAIYKQNKNAKTVKELIINDPYGQYVNPRKDQKVQKRYTANMLLNYKIVAFHTNKDRSCLIHCKHSFKKRNYKYGLYIKNCLQTRRIYL